MHFYTFLLSQVSLTWCSVCIVLCIRSQLGKWAWSWY